MGCSLSCIRLMMMPSTPKFTGIRIISVNGVVEEIEHPTTVAEVTGKQAKHFLFTQAELLAAASTPLKLEMPLEAGRVYFLLPSTLFQWNVSPEEFSPIARKLVLIAQNTPAKSKCSQHFNGIKKSGKTQSWKPILSTIRERSFNRRSESDLLADQELKFQEQFQYAKVR